MRRLISIIAALLCMTTTAVSPAVAAEGNDLKLVTTDELKGMMDSGEEFVLINALSPLEFTQTKIEGSINVPTGKLAKGEAELSADKSARLIFYCKGPK